MPTATRQRVPDMTPPQFAAIEARLGLGVGELAARLGCRRWAIWSWRTGWRVVPSEVARTLRAMLEHVA